MRKHLFLLWIGVAALTACGDDDTPVAPVLNKVTKISCYQNGGTTPLFTADINYTGEGNLSNIRFSGTQNLLFIYTGDKFTVTDTGSGTTTTAEYTLSGNVITRMTVSKENPYASNEVYVSDEYVYQYTGSSLTRTSWTARWPREDEAGYAGYEERMYPEYEKYTWENGNVVLFAQSQDNREMRYEYNEVAEAPANFPFRVIGTFAPVGFEVVSPLNLLYGTQNRNLPKRAYTYTVPNESAVNAEYTFSYTTVGDYITGMTVEANDYSSGGTNTYTYQFEYNYYNYKYVVE